MTPRALMAGTSPASRLRLGRGWALKGDPNGDTILYHTTTLGLNASFAVSGQSVVVSSHTPNFECCRALTDQKCYSHYATPFIRLSC